MYNLVHHLMDFKIKASWTFSATGHGKGPCDGVGAVIKSMATQHLLRGGPSASFSSVHDFFQWCFEKNDRFVIPRPRTTLSLTTGINQMPEPNRPIEVRWLPADIINKTYEETLKQRWSKLSSRGINSLS